jgi:hypothetical protein
MAGTGSGVYRFSRPSYTGSMGPKTLNFKFIILFQFLQFYLLLKYIPPTTGSFHLLQEDFTYYRTISPTSGRFQLLHEYMVAYRS